VIDSCW